MAATFVALCHQVVGTVHPISVNTTSEEKLAGNYSHLAHIFGHTSMIDMTISQTNQIGSSDEGTSFRQTWEFTATWLVGRCIQSKHCSYSIYFWVKIYAMSGKGDVGISAIAVSLYDLGSYFPK